MKIQTRIAAGGTALALVSILGPPVIPAIAAPLAPQTDTATSVPNGTTKVTGTLNGRSFSGTASNLSAAVVGGKAVLKGTVTAASIGTTSFTADVKAVNAAPPAPPAGGAASPVAAPPGTPPNTSISVAPRSNAPLCTALTLDVDNLHLDLLGLKVLVPPPGLHVIIAGQNRPGALLGTLLCALAGPDSPQPGAAPAAAPVPAPAAVPAAPAPIQAPAP
jgi:hypothetical protein